MLQFFRFILWFLSFILLVVLVNVSFFSNLNNNKVDLDFLESASLSWANINNINFLDNIYSSIDYSFKITQDDSNIDIVLDKWVFILDLNDLTKKYKISWDWFNLDLKSTWDIYIDTTWDKNLIFALDSTFVLNFLDKDNKFMNSYFMYPHEFIKFNPKLTFSYKEVDLYRIRTVTKNGYFKYKLSDILDLEKKEYFNSILWESNVDFFTEYIKNKKISLNNNTNFYQKIASLKPVSFPFSEYLIKYNSYFVNDSKRAVFLQNKIYNDLILLFNEDEFNLDHLNIINNNLNELKKIDTKKYYNSINIINNFFKIIILRHDVNNLKKIENFIYLINSNITISSLEKYISLKSIYFNYDYFISSNTIQSFDKFLDSYLKNSWIIEKNENFTLNNKEKLSEIESFVFFLEEYIKAYLFLDGIDRLKSEISILTKYNNLNEMIYFSWKKDSIKIKTSLNQNKDLLLRLENFLRTTFFEKDRDKIIKVLLLKNLDKQILDFNILLELEKEVKKLLDLFNYNKISIYWDDSKQEKEYYILSILFDEEFLALKDYEKYKSSNNSQLKKLLNSTGLWAKTFKTYTVSDINLYFSQFKWVYFNQKNIIESDWYFDISNVMIHNIYYDIKLFPQYWNKIDFFEGWSNNFLFSYDLDEIQEYWDEKYKSTRSEDKYKYDFYNFFDQKLKKQISTNTSQINQEEICALRWQISDNKWWCKDIEEEEATIFVFKKYILLEEEFIIIKDYFDINYSNLDIKLNENIYLIKINNANIELNLWDNKWSRKYLLDFSSYYDFDNHSFYNISFKIINEKDKDIHNGETFYLEKSKVKITDLKNTLEDYFN